MTFAPFPWAAFLLFALVNCVTPGPNIIMLAGSGGRFGVRRTMPQLWGVCVGFPFMLLVVQAWASPVMSRLPQLMPALTAVSLAYVTWLAWRVFVMGGGELKVAAGERPMTFLETAAFQWVNGKAWQIAVMTATLYVAESWALRLRVAGTYAVLIFFTHLAWVELGRRVAGLLAAPRARRLYFTTLAVLLLLSTWPQGLARLRG